MAGSVKIGGIGPGSVEGLPRLRALIAMLPETLVAEVKAELDDSADELARSVQRVTPVSELEDHPGQLRDSVHKEDGRHPLEVLVVVDAQDAHGNYIAPHVEFGHKDKGGGHVPAQPFFWTSIKVYRPKLRAKLGAAVRRALKRSQAGA